ncbi:hypothetical protein DX933_15830 [Ornithinibacillus gellani]|uniref:hypothetical protein n=1 Tax=Ornithinibacillus gellani TaxID=2293253 RepID=UPI000F473B7C|nr:hypothetical protein [Ornithinibacillus gellani]TQS71148.1 hypothetical protein DX933_15830 [Ornithinibacillus gellani]
MLKGYVKHILYLPYKAEKKVPYLDSHVPTICPVCEVLQEPEPTAISYYMEHVAKVEFYCVNPKCQSTFSALYNQGAYDNKYHFFTFL